MDKDGYYILFDGKTFNGWRGYDKDVVPGRWIIDEGAIKFNGTGGGEAQEADGGDLIFGHKFKNFELSIDWKKLSTLKLNGANWCLRKWSTTPPENLLSKAN